MNKKFLVGFSVLGVAAAAFWACGDGDVITKGGDDELALLNYGPPFAEGDEGNMKTLLNQAMADCAADEACAAKMEAAKATKAGKVAKVEILPPPVQAVPRQALLSTHLLHR